MAKQQSIKVKQLILDLESGNPVKISAALKLLQVNGTISVLTPLANLLLHPVDTKNKDEILEFFSTLNDSNAVDAMIELIKNEFNTRIAQIVDRLTKKRIEDGKKVILSFEQTIKKYSACL